MGAMARHRRLWGALVGCAIAAALVTGSGSARADEPSSTESEASRLEGAEVTRLREVNGAMRTTGKVFTVLGILHMIAGTGAFIYGAAGDDSGHSGGSGPAMILFGAPLLCHGAFLVGIGGPLWGLGEKRIKTLDALTTSEVPPATTAIDSRTLVVSVGF
jgi:hypothetical protein